MALDKDFDGNNDIAQFLEKFKEQPFPSQAAPEDFSSSTPSVRPAQYARSFEKLEQKIHELEEKFEASTTQNRLILTELARTREVVERQKDKDAFLEHLSRTIATLRTSVENLARTQEANTFSFHEPITQRSFDPLPEVYPAAQPSAITIDAQVQLQREREEQTRRFNSLRQKASQLKAVNSALDREIKKAQQEKMDALKKSADQAKEILSLRDQLSAAEERFKSFDFEGRIISIKQEYQQKVTNLESRLKEMSDTCMQQVEEIESLKAENIKLQHASAEKEALQAQLADKEQELAAVRSTIAALQNQNSGEHTKRLSVFTSQLRVLEEQRDRLAVELEQSQMSLETIRREKEMLEKNFQQLVTKINQNDAVIDQLKQKIEVLGQQNTQLNQHNEELTQANTTLSQDNATLSQHNEELTRANTELLQNNETLTQHNEELTQTNRDLSQNNEELSHDNAELTQRNASLVQHNEQLVTHNVTLSQRTQALEGETASLKSHIEQLSTEQDAFSHQSEELKTLHAQVEKLSQEKKILSDEHDTLQTQAQTLEQENQQLRTQSAALLAARVVQEHHQKQAQQRAQEGMEQGQRASVQPAPPLRRPAAPVLHSLGRKMVLSSARQEEDWEVVSTRRVVPAPPNTHIQSSKDLPEIKVTTSPVAEPLFDDEDFLEKTNSFIGRMKWSIFREDR